MIETEVMLLDWSDTAKGGEKLVLQLPPGGVKPFRSMTLAKKGMAGQRLQAVFVVLDDEAEELREQHKGGALSRLAGQWCHDPRFQRWLGGVFAERWNLCASEHDGPSDIAAAVVRELCGVDSRATIDHDPKAKAAFDELVRRPFATFLDHNRTPDMEHP